MLGLRYLRIRSYDDHQHVAIVLALVPVMTSYNDVLPITLS